MSKSDDFIKKYLGGDPVTTQVAIQQLAQATPTQPAQPTSESKADAFISKYYTPVDNNYIYSYITDWGKYAKDAKSAYDGLNWESATSGDLDRFNDTEKDLSSRAAAIRSYVEAHKKDYDDEQYKGIISQLDEMGKFQSSFRNRLSEAQKYYSQWATEDDYNNYLEQQRNMPSVVVTSPQPQKKSPGIPGIRTAVDLANEAEAIRNGTYQPAIDMHKNRDKEGFFRTPAALSDGFQIRDIPAIVGGAAADIGGNFVEGAADLFERAGDAINDTVGGAVNRFANFVTGGDYDRVVALSQAFNAIEEGKDPALAPSSADEALATIVVKDIVNAKELADIYVRNPAKGLLGIDVENSFLGEKADALVQSAGQLAAQYGMSIAGVPWFVTSGLSSYGGELQNAYAQGATRDEAVKSGIITAGAEILSEYLFAGDLFVGEAGAALAADSLSKAVTEKALNSFVRHGINIAGEGFEEAFSQFLSRFGSAAYRDENIGQILFSEEALDEYIDAAVGGVVLGGGMTAVNIATGNHGSNKQNKMVAPDSAANPLASLDAILTPQSAPTAENLSGIAQDRNAAITGTAGQETADRKSQVSANDFIMAEDYDHQTINTPAYRLNEYTQHQKDNWANSKRIVLFEGVQQFRRFIQNALSGAKQTNKKMYFGMVSADLAAEIKSATGVDVEGYNLSLGENEIRKINKSHGNESTETTRGQRAVTEADYLNIPDVVQSPDTISLSNKTYEGKPVIEFRQYNGNETTVVAAVVSDKRLDLFVQTTFINKKTGSIATPESVQADSITPEATGGTAPKNSIPNTGKVVNPDIASSENSTTSVGAAPAGFDPLTHAMLQYGNIPDGENAVRDDSLPVSMDGESKVSWVARTALGAEATPDAYAEDIRKEVANGNLSYIPITNDATVQKVEKHIREVGWQEAYTEWVANVEKGITGAEMTATGAVLLNNAANAGDHKSWRNILYHFQKLGTNTAQGLQAFRILKTLSPSDKLWMIEKSAQQMVKDLGLDVEITLDEALVEEYDNAQTDEQREAALDKIVKSVAKQIPPTVMEKVNSWRYTMMLGNLRTQLRNLTGNVSMAAVTSLKNTVATTLQYLVHYISGGKTELTRTYTVSKEMMQSGLQDFDNMESIVNNGGRYSLHDSETSDIAQRIQDKRKIFNFKLAEWYRKGTNWAMDKGDVLFSKPAYARALAGYLKAHGVTDADFSKVDPELMDKARLYAVKEAQEQTFRDTNAISQWVSKIGRRKDTPAAAKILAEGVLPFRKTPANIAVRAWEYSPLGVINSVVDTVNAARSGSDTTAADAINSWAKTLTGGGLIGLGMLLQSLGLIRGTEDDDEQRLFDSLNGWQEYSLVLPDGTNLTIDALSPAALPLLVGAQMKAAIDGEGFSLDQVLGCMSALADPMVDMSLMSGIKSLIEDIRYSEEPLGQIAVNTLIDYATQIVTNSVVGQLERSTEKQRMQTYVDPDSAVPDWIQKALGGISAKTPGWDYQQIPYINAWGEKEENPPFGLNLLENAASPFYFDTGEKTPLTEELNRLYNDAQQDGVYPSRPDKKQTYTDKNGVKHKGYGLDAQEYVEFATVQGQTQKRILDEMISSDAYKSLPDSYKAEAIEEAYWCANRQARFEVLSDNDEEYHKWISRCWGTKAEFILSRIHLRYLTDQVMPESGYKSARQVQVVEQIAAADDGYTENDQEKMLWEALSEAKLKTYNKVKGMGYDIDDFAAVYRIYQKADDSKTYNKEHAIRDIMRKLNVSESTATALYEAY